MAAPVINAANSMSLFVIVPDGLLAETSRFLICCGNGRRKIIGRAVGGLWGVGSHAPPMPSLLASTAPRKAGGLGTNDWMGVGVVDRVVASASQS